MSTLNTNEPARLAVLGSPIAHSKSPALHRAAYRALGLDWSYEAIELTGAGLADFLASRDASWRGLSLTMPLKQDVLPLLDGVDELAELTGAANTVALHDGRRLGFNTDVGGIVRTLGESGVDAIRCGVLIGAGATAASALAAMAQLGAEQVRVLVRRDGAAAPLLALGRRVGLVVEELPLGALAELGAGDGELVIATVPGGTDLGVIPSPSLVTGAALLDVAYDPWPSALGASWLAAGGVVVHGLGMLLHQAVLQVRVFANGDPLVPLADEASVVEAMRAAIA